MPIDNPQPDNPNQTENGASQGATRDATTSTALTAAGMDEVGTNIMAYPASRLSPRIIPNDMSTIKTRGATQVQKVFLQRMSELKKQYEVLMDEFHWNKLVWESRFSFEPTMGEKYFLYQDEVSKEATGVPTFSLSMINPQEWSHKNWIGSFELGADSKWHPIELKEDFELNTVMEAWYAAHPEEVSA